jgi:hypothetical protein
VDYVNAVGETFPQPQVRFLFLIDPYPLASLFKQWEERRYVI